MPIDSRIPLGFQAPRIESADPGTVAFQGMKLRDLADARRIRQAEEQRAAGIRGAWTLNPDGSVNREETLANLAKVDKATAAQVQAEFAKQAREAEAANLEKQKQDFEYQGKVRQHLGQQAGALAMIDDEAERARIWQEQVRPEMVASGYYGDGSQIPGDLPDENTINHIAFATLPIEKQREILRAQAKEGREVELHAETVKGKKLENVGKERENTAGELNLAAQLVPQDRESWDDWRASLSPALQRRIPQEFSPAAVARVENMALPVKDRKELEDKAAARSETIRHNQAMESKPAGGGINSTMQADIDATVEAIINGDQPPPNTSSRPTQFTIALTGALGRAGYPLAQAQKDWSAIQKHIATLNGPQQERLRQAVTFTKHSLDNIEDLYQQWQDSGLAGRFKTFNAATLKAAKELGGETGAVAQALEAQIADLVSELGTVYKGGNSSTDETLKLAKENLEAKWDEPTFRKAIAMIRKNLTIRYNSIISSEPVGVRPNSPYLSDWQRGGGGEGAATGGETEDNDPAGLRPKS